MTAAKPDLLTLSEFLQQPETKPVREYINGKYRRQVTQKPILKAHHARLQRKLIDAINAVAEADRLCLS